MKLKSVAALTLITACSSNPISQFGLDQPDTGTTPTGESGCDPFCGNDPETGLKGGESGSGIL